MYIDTWVHKMETKQITILNELLTAINQNNFDLEAWKLKANIVLSKIFGSNDPKLKLVENLQYNFSSWTLRDHSGGKQHDPVKTHAKEIIEAALLEIELNSTENPVLKEFEKQLTGAQFAILKSIIEQNNRQALNDFLDEIDKKNKNEIFINLIFNS